MGVVIETCTKYPGGRTRIRGADVTAIPQRTQVSVRVYSNGYVTAVAVAAGQSQRFYSGVGIFNWYYLSSAHPELSGLGGPP